MTVDSCVGFFVLAPRKMLERGGGWGKALGRLGDKSVLNQIWASEDDEQVERLGRSINRSTYNSFGTAVLTRFNVKFNWFCLT